MNLRELQRRGWAVGWICLLVLGLGAGRLTAQEQPTPNAAAVPPKVTGLDRIQAIRGERVRFTFDKKDGWPEEPKDVQVFLDGLPAGSAASLDTDAQFFDLVVPGCSPYLPLGAHAVSVTIGDPPVPVSVAAAAGRLEILPNNGGIDPKITGVFPVTVYPEGKPRQYSLRIQGEGFARDACDNKISLGGEVKEICWKGTGCSQGILGEITPSGLISLSNILLGDHVLDNVGIKVGPRPESKSAIRLSRVSRRFPVRIALIVSLIIIGGVIFAVGRSNLREIGGQKFGISRLFIDAETETYSLSKLQFFIWTLVAVSAYLYLSVCTWLVQGKLVFLDVPDGLPGIVMISAATTVAAQWTQSAKGPKGAGGLFPTISDLISAGGVVVPERFQFLVWTVLGASIFSVLTFLHDPGSIADLPTVPQGFLTLMGISSAGYLGGKMVRKAGPVIDQIQRTSIAAANQIVLTLTGRCLSTEATYRIRAITVGAVTTPEIIPLSMIVGGKPMGKAPEEPGMDSTFVKVLELSLQLPATPPAWASGPGELTIINPDGLADTMTFP